MTNLSFHNRVISHNKWLEREFEAIDFKDKRLKHRFIKTINLINSKVSGSINQSCKTWKDTKGAYRLFSNDKCDADHIYHAHYQETQRRIKGKKLVFAVQDTTYLDYDTHKNTKDLGSISKAHTKHRMGLIMHSTLIVTKKGLPLGLTSQQCWARPVREERAKEKSRRKYTTPIHDKESYKWITGLEETIKNTPEDTSIVTLGDRESDIFDFLWRAKRLGSLFVIRNRQNRKFICSSVGKTKIQERLKELKEKKAIKLKIPRKGSNKGRTAILEIK